MENFLALMKSISDSWMSPSSVVIAMDMTIAFLCGAGLVFLLLPSLKESPESPPPESERDMPKDVKRRHSKTRKKTATVKGGRGSRKYVEETQTPPQPMKISTNQLFRDSTPPPLGNPNQKMDHLPLFQLLSYLKVLEGLIQKEFSHIFWSTSSMFSEAVVATAHVLRKPSLAEHKTVRFRDTCDPAQALPQAKEPPQLPQDLPLPPELVTPCLERVSGGVQEMEMVSGSTPNQTPPCFKSRTCRRACPTAERGTQTSLPTENQPWQHGLYWKDTKGYDIQNHQAAISKPTGKLSRSTLHDRATRPASILSDHCQTAHNKEEPQNEDKATNGREQQGTPGRFLPSRKLTQLQGHFPANNDYCKSKTQLSQPAPPSILNSNICKCNKMIGSELLGVPLEKAIATCDIHNSIKKGSGLEGQDLPCTSSSSPGKAQKPRNTALRTDKLSCMNPAEHRSFLDSRTERKLAPNIPQLPRKRRKRPYLQILEARDITPPGVPASNLPQVVYPSSPICESKAEYYSKATPVLENLHHQDPGGTSVESISDARLESAASEHSLAEVQETQRMPPPAASHGASKVYPDPRQRSLDVQQPAFCFQVKPPQSGTMQETETGSLQPSSSPKMAKHAPQKRFQGVDSGQPCWRVIVIDPEEGAPPSAAKLTNTVEVKEEPPPSWRVSLGANEIHNGQAIGISPREFVFSEANKRPSHLQTPTLQHSQQSGVKPQACSMIDLISREQPQPWLVRHDPDGPSTLHHTKVSLPAEHSLSSFQNTYQPPQAFQGLGDVCMKRHQRVETKETSIPKDTTEVTDLKGVHPHEEGWSTIRSTDIRQGERLGSVKPSIPSSTQLKDATKTWIPEKGEATPKSSWNALQYENSSTKYLGQGDSLQDDCLPSAAEQIQETVTRNKIIYNMVAEIQALVNILVRILETTEEAPSKVQGCKVESLTSQLGGSSHASEGLYDTHHSRAASRRSCDHASLEMYNYPFTYRGIGDELLTGTEVQRPCAQYLNQVNRGMGFDQLPMPKESELSCRYRGTRDKQEPGFADHRACGPRRTKIVMGHCPHRSTKGHKHSFRYRETGDEQQSGVDHKAFDPHQSTKKEMGSGCSLRPKEKHPVKHRGTDCPWPSTAAQ